MKLKYLQMALQALLALVFLAAAAANLAGEMTLPLQLMGFPDYLTTILGVAYPIAVVCMYQNKILFLQEWAWGGLFISLVGAAGAHMYTGLSTAAPAMALQVLLITAYLLKKYLDSQYMSDAAS